MGPVTVQSLQAMAGGMGQGFRGASASTVQQPGYASSSAVVNCSGVQVQVQGGRGGRNMTFS